MDVLMLDREINQLAGEDDLLLGSLGLEEFIEDFFLAERVGEAFFDRRP